MASILVAEQIDQYGIDLLRAEHHVDVRIGLSTVELKDVIGDYAGLVVRSETKVTEEIIEAASRLQVIGRAGVGVDNIDVAAATRRGIAVVNAPTGNTLAAAEHAMALMLALARNVPQADASIRRGEWSRKDYVGVEVHDKTLGIIGLGKVGSEVARRAQSFQMRLLGFDPYVSPEYATFLDVQLTELDRLLAESDFVTIHTPLTNNTRRLIGAQELARMKDGVRIINTARGGLVDEAALLQAISQGKVSGAALDVFAEEPLKDDRLLAHNKIILTPHLGASTAEAQMAVAKEVAEQVLLVLRGQPAWHTVNAPMISPEVHAVLAPYMQVASTLGTLAAELADGQFSHLTINYQGDIAEYESTILKASALVGFLSAVSAARVNLVNATLIAEQRGLQVTEQKSTQSDHYNNLIILALRTDVGTTVLAGTLMRGEVHLVRVNEYWLDVVPSSPYMLVIEHMDRPGMIGAVGNLTGNLDINIGFMEVGRIQVRGQATMVVGLDDPVPDSVLLDLRAIPHVRSVRLVRF
jgi:D-3-phosphoglycerate dehydrogenase